MSSLKTKLLEASDKAKIQDMIDKEAERVRVEMETLVAIVKQLNETLVDKRLDAKKGLMDALDELRSFNNYLGTPITIYVNGNRDSQGEMHVWFEA